MQTTHSVQEIEVDSRQRLPLAKVSDGRHSRYRVTHLDGGELLLTPVVSLTERELEMLGNPERMASIERGIEQAKAGTVTRYEPGHFSKLLAEHGDNPFDEDMDLGHTAKDEALTSDTATVSGSNRRTAHDEVKTSDEARVR